MRNTFPKQIYNLPTFEGPFEAFKLRTDACDVLFASYPAGTTIAPHAHDTENVGVITQGTLILTMHGKTTRYSVGDWYHVPAHVEHSAKFEHESAEIEFWFKQL